MAKCVIVIDKRSEYSGRVIRVPEEYARELVWDGRAKYSPRSEWKKGDRKFVKSLGRIRYVQK